MILTTAELRSLAANTPVHDRARYALRWAASEIDKLNAIIECLQNDLAEANKATRAIIASTGKGKP